MFSILLVLMLLLGLSVLTAAAVRHCRLQQMQYKVKQILDLPTLDSRPELAAMAGLSAVELLWHWQQIDPEVIAAADFCSTMDIHSGFDFARYIDQHVSGMNAESLTGFKYRLMGYVGEQRVATLLSDQGHVVEVATTANQPVWDLMVDGHAVNVKTVADIAEIKATALAHPDVTYIVPIDARGTLTDNMQRLGGFSHHQMQHATDQAIIDTSPMDAIDSAAMHLPIIPLVFSIVRNRKAVQQGRDVEVAAKHVVLDTLGRGGGAGLGALIGGTVGTLAGPVGTVVGTALGGMLGSLLGAHYVDELKKIPLKKAIHLFEQQLQQFGRVYANRLARVLHILYQPHTRQQQCLVQIEHQLKYRQKGWRWWLFPDFYTVLLAQTQQYAVQQIEQQQCHLAKIETQLNQAQQQGDYRPLGLIMLNVPEMRVILGVDLLRLRSLQQQREQVYYERSQLHPDIFPPKKNPVSVPNNQINQNDLVDQKSVA